MMRVRSPIQLILMIAALPLGSGASFVAHGSEPGNPVATVDGQPIEKRDFDHWMTIAAKSAYTTVPDPATGYRRCIATKRKATAAPANGRHKVTDGQLERQCKQEYEGMRNQVMQLLISFKWIQGEA